MKKLTSATLALLVAGSLTACAKTAELPTLPSESLPTATASTTPGDTMSSGPTSDDATGSGSATTGSGSATTGSGSATTSGTAAPATLDQTTPEAAMTSWLGAMVAGDGQAVCTIMAFGGKPMSSIPGAADGCASSITPMLDQIKQLGGVFQGLTISGATVKGDTATFESVTTTPALAADVVSNFKAVKIGGKWYVSQG
jgi:hypothetical protein